jgi:uncharacterized protein YdeI (YjbR/CyaY-like superfamily)
MVSAPEPRFFATPAEFRRWLEANADTSRELLVGFHKKGSGRASITWPEAVDEALCHGWIDGVRRRVDDASYCIRFTPRTPRSTWSAVNIRRAEELIGLGRMRPAGLRAFERRTPARSAIYSYEQGAATLDAADEQLLRANQAAWEFFSAQPAWYRKAAIWWVVSARREETRRRRLATLVEDSEHGRTVRQLTRPGRASGGPVA